MKVISSAAPRPAESKQLPHIPAHGSGTIVNVGDWVIMKSDKDITPDQRFWVGQVCNITRAECMPNINLPDPIEIPGADRFFKIWWSSAEKEYGKYTRDYYTVQGKKQRQMSWESENTFIAVLEDGLASTNTIRKKKKENVRKLELAIKKAWGQQQQEEKLDYEEVVDSITVDDARQLLGKGVETSNGEAGLILGIDLPKEGDLDRRIHFKVLFDNDLSEELFPYEEVSKMLIS